MANVILVTGLKKIEGRPDKLKLAIIPQTNVGKRPASILRKKCAEANNSIDVGVIIADVKNYIIDNKIEEIEIVNGFYVSDGSGLLTSIEPVEGLLFSRIKSECCQSVPANV